MLGISSTIYEADESYQLNMKMNCIGNHVMNTLSTFYTAMYHNCLYSLPSDRLLYWNVFLQI